MASILVVVKASGRVQKVEQTFGRRGGGAGDHNVVAIRWGVPGGIVPLPMPPMPTRRVLEAAMQTAPSPRLLADAELIRRQAGSAIDEFEELAAEELPDDLSSASSAEDAVKAWRITVGCSENVVTLRLKSHSGHFRS